MQGRVTLRGLVPTPGQKGQRGGLGEGRTAARLPSLSSSLYCPKDNIEEALLLLLISESMVSDRALPGLQPPPHGGKLRGSGLDHQVLAEISPHGCHCSRLCLPPRGVRLAYEI